MALDHIAGLFWFESGQPQGKIWGSCSKFTASLEGQESQCCSGGAFSVPRSLLAPAPLGLLPKKGKKKKPTLEPVFVLPG